MRVKSDRFIVIRAGLLGLALVGALSVSAARGQEVVGTKNGKVYHTHPEACQGATQIMPENLVKWPSAEDAEKEGRRLCRMCLKLDEEPGGTGRGKPRKPKPASPPPRAGPTPTEETTSAISQSGRVKTVLPGGTLVLKSGDKARLLGVYVPQAGQSGADDAIKLIKEETRGGDVRITWDSGTSAAARRDGCGRLLVYVAVPNGRADLGEELIGKGLAACDREPAFEKEALYSKRQEEAWWAGRGIWKRLEGAAGKAEVVTGKYAAHYHRPDCPHVSLLIDAVTLSVNEAKGRQLSPCELYREEPARK